LELVLEVAHRSQARTITVAPRRGRTREQPSKERTSTLDHRPLPDQRHSFLEGESGCSRRSHRHGDDDAVGEGAGAADQVLVPARDRVERSGIAAMRERQPSWA